MLVVTLLVGIGVLLWSFIKMIAVLFAAPFVVYLSLAQNFSSTNTGSGRAIFYWITSVPRYIFITPAIPSFPIFLLATCYYVYRYLAATEGIIFSLLGTLTLFGLMIFFFVLGLGKMNARLQIGELFMETLILQLELISFVASFVPIVGISRTYDIFNDLVKPVSYRPKEQLLTCIWKNFWFTCLDYVISPAAWIILVTGIRLRSTIRALPNIPETRVHLFVAHHAYFAIVETILVVAALVTDIILIYRLPGFVSALFQVHETKFIKLCVDQLLYLMIDVPAGLGFLLTLVTIYQFSHARAQWQNKELSFHSAFIASGARVLRDGLCALLFGLPVTITLWKTPLLFRTVQSKDVDKKYLAFVEVVGLWFNDMLAILCFIPVALSIYRLPNLWTKSKTDGFHAATFESFHELCIDLPYIVLGLLALWRIPYLLYIVLTQLSSAQERRQEAKYQVVEMLIDIPFMFSVLILMATILHIATVIAGYNKYRNDPSKEKWRRYRTKILVATITLPLQIPVLVCFYLTLFSVYRMPSLIRMAKQVKSDPEKAKIIFRQAGAICYDLFAVLCSSLLLVTAYRASNLFKIFKEDSLIRDAATFADMTVAHRQIFRETWYLIRDIPLFILILVSSFTIWRIGFIAKLLKEEKDYKKRMIALGLSALLTILDIPMIIVTLVLLISWRHHNVVDILRKVFIERSEAQMHKAIFGQLYQLLIDIPFILLSVLLLWRIPFLLFQFRSTTFAYERRKLVITNLKLLLTDVPYLAMTLILVASLYRIRYLVRYLKISLRRSKLGTNSKYNTVCWSPIFSFSIAL
jgi:hypothetical protein